MQADEIIDQAKTIILERENRYGDFHLNAIRTATLQTIIHEEPRHPEQFCLDMVAAKLARIYNSPGHLDNYIDAICYLAEAAALTKTPKDEL